MIYTKSKEVKEIVTPLYVENWESEKMQKYCINKASVVAVLSNERVFVIEKPSIKTDFCFGYGMYAQASDEEINKACELADNARKNVEYFLNKNMEDINRWIEILKRHKEDMENNGYSNHPIMYCPEYGNSNSKLIGISAIKIFDVEFYKNKGFEELSKEDTEIIIEAYKQAKIIFAKRLQTYLKKYGLSKLNVWTYLADWYIGLMFPKGLSLSSPIPLKADELKRRRIKQTMTIKEKLENSKPSERQTTAMWVSDVLEDFNEVEILEYILSGSRCNTYIRSLLEEIIINQEITKSKGGWA